MSWKIKVLQSAAVDVTIKFLLLPLIDRLIQEGYEVHIACSPGRHLRELAELGYTVHPITIARRISPLSNLKSLWQLYRLMRRERFDIVHVHTPVAAVLGRVAAKLARVPIIIYTAHGFYFHELMAPWKRRLIIWVERLLGRYCTDMLFTQSGEDRGTAIKERIATEERAIWIGNGVDTQAFTISPKPSLRTELGLDPEDKVIGFIGRLVGEKGVEELLEALGQVIEEIPRAKLLVVGDTLESDRDRRATERLQQLIRRNNLEDRIKFTGFREDIPGLLSIMDLFVLPSHREGMPRTILEAMAAGKPVVTTNIRGCREEVVGGVTGLLVPVKDPEALAQAIIRVLSDENLARRMGQAGRKRAVEEFDERFVLERQIKVYQRLVERDLQTSSRSRSFPS
ncbi:MAG: glycosyltransferase family 4 protein [Candidatus Acetothermia bacterium]|jgi:glycosyltransferase involved in cell wall biosynthesis|nr:glycosyltransferase family 4 protein [Candidatus Acetothermia bacterium]MDH7505861.1 glycosyltransferase family 4 protein [Candidatus Acetothermia bacterium]